MHRPSSSAIASCCVQMPSLEARPILEAKLGLPCLSAATGGGAEAAV